MIPATRLPARCNAARTPNQSDARPQQNEPPIEVRTITGARESVPQCWARIKAANGGGAALISGSLPRAAFQRQRLRICPPREVSHLSRGASPVRSCREQPAGARPRSSLSRSLCSSLTASSGWLAGRQAGRSLSGPPRRRRVIISASISRAVLRCERTQFVGAQEEAVVLSGVG